MQLRRRRSAPPAAWVWLLAAVIFGGQWLNLTHGIGHARSTEAAAFVPSSASSLSSLAASDRDAAADVFGHARDSAACAAWAGTVGSSAVAAEATALGVVPAQGSAVPALLPACAARRNVVRGFDARAPPLA